MKIDLDCSEEQRVAVIQELGYRLVKLDDMLKFKWVKSDISKTVNGMHAKVFFKTEIPLDDKDIVFLQAFLGSDLYRELYNWRRVKNGMKEWNVLFRRKYVTRELGDKRFYVEKSREY